MMDSLFSPEWAAWGAAWVVLVRPLARLLAVMAFSLLLAQTLESMGWSAIIARLTAPFVRLAHFGQTAGASFSIAFLSPSAANAVLAQGLADGKLGRGELLAANVFNSTPAFLLHLPSLAALAWTFLGRHAWLYIAVVFAAALLRTLGVAVVGHFFLPVPVAACSCGEAGEKRAFPASLRQVWPRMQKRLVRMALYTVPIYCLVYLLQVSGFFSSLESFMTRHVGSIGVLRPQAISIAVLYLAADTGVAFSAAAALLHTGAIDPRQAVLALLLGNILSSPVRAFRHQLPSYSGYFAPASALLLVGVNQVLRALTLALAALAYALWV